MKNMRTLEPWEVLAMGAVVGIACGGLAALLVASVRLDDRQRTCPHFQLTNQTLDCKSIDESATRLSALHQAVYTAVGQYIEQGKATRISVFERDLRTNQWEGTNETDLFAPASLMKLPLMMAYFKVAELEPSLLNVELTYQPSALLNSKTQHFAPPNPLVPGQAYSVTYLIEKMIVDSDNDAAALLLSHIDPKIFDSTLVDLGIRIPQHGGAVDFVSAKSYAVLFRVLYNASYLTRENSEKALEMLSRSLFREGLPGGVPQSIVVAHKFGEREMPAPDGGVRRELHDCGIVYKEDSPYILCIMTEGTDWSDLVTIIRDISTLVYQKI